MVCVPHGSTANVIEVFIGVGLLKFILPKLFKFIVMQSVLHNGIDLPRGRAPTITITKQATEEQWHGTYMIHITPESDGARELAHFLICLDAAGRGSCNDE